MSTTSQEKSFDLRRVIEEYKKLDATDRFLDLMALILGLIFGINFIIISSIKSIERTPANVAFMTLPLFMSGIILSYRMKLKEDDADKVQIRKELMAVTAGIFVLHLLAVFVTWS